MFQFIRERQIGWGDLDSAGIVYYPRYYEWIDTTNHFMFDAIGLNHKMLLHCRHLQFPLVESRCTYIKPGRYMDKIRIISEIEEIARKTITLKTRIVLAEDHSLLAEGMEKRICIDASDPEHLKAQDIPEDILTMLREKQMDCDKNIR
ncbi:MAG: thioesterase family protein [Syntrophales bacterium]|nr:hotdog domain-containing protein [Syntrophales bacterium]